MDFNGKVALVTGAASGIGRQIALSLLERGASVVICDKSAAALAAVKAELGERLPRVMLAQADITVEAEVERMFAAVRESFGVLDYLVNNAGINFVSRIEEQDIEGAREVIEINLIAKMIVTKHAVPLLRLSASPAIVNTSSRVAYRPLAGAAAYGACEAGIIALSRTSALELAPYGIRVNTVCPGRTLTVERLAAGDIPPDAAAYAEKSPRGRVGNTLDVANAVMFLLSDEADNVNGEELNVNGGVLLV
ncbi:MAG: SDR family oxidoreductase [Clostridia bacterium]|nr:SDR family oxidoreductase [Clostridia bacterium]